MKVCYSSVLGLVAGLCCFASGAVLTGRVVDNSATPVAIPNATVSLKSNDSAVYSDAKGQFSLTIGITGAVAQKFGDKNQNMRVSGTTLFFASQINELVTIDLFNMSGRKLCTTLNQSFEAGSHRVNLMALLKKNPVNGLFVMRIKKGVESLVATYMPNGETGGFVALNNARAHFASGGLGKKSASVDSVIVYRMGYIPKTLPLTDYSTQALGDVVLSLTPEEVTIARKVDSLLALMTINEKAGQMTEVQINSGSASDRLTDDQVASQGIGSVFNGGSDPSVPANTPLAWSTIIDRVQTAVLTKSRLKIPMIYGQDCIHGVGEVAGCEVFQYNIGLGCTHDTALVAKIGRITASECAGLGVKLNYAPCIASVRNEKWGRTAEGFGENPEINSLMGAAYLRGLQGDGDLSKPGAVAGCAKHFLGDGATDNGTNNGTTSISEATMRAVHLPQYAAAAREKMACVMPSYHTWKRNGTSFLQTLDTYDLTTILKGELGFDGFCLSDWDAVAQACKSYNVDCVAQAINAGLDMAMIVANVNPAIYINSIVSGVSSGTISKARVDDAVKRILRIKFRMHLWDNAKSLASLRDSIGSPAHRAVAREAVRKSLVLLKNESSALPLKTSDKIVVVGKWANDMGRQCGGWTIGWQGDTGNVWGIKGQTISDGFKEVGGSNVTYDLSGSNLSGADKIVVVVGESPYAEGSGDSLNALDLTNTNGAGALISKCKASGKPVIVVLISGRPMIIDGEIGNCSAFVAAWLPGSEGGGIADVLYNKYNFTGTLTHSWPVSYGQIPINTGATYSDEQHGSGGVPLFAYGFGLKY